MAPFPRDEKLVFILPSPPNTRTDTRQDSQQHASPEPLPSYADSADCAVETASADSPPFFRETRRPTAATEATSTTNTDLETFPNVCLGWEAIGPSPTRILMDHFPGPAPDGDPSIPRLPVQGRAKLVFPPFILPVDLRQLEESWEKVEVKGLAPKVDEILDQHGELGNKYDKCVAAFKKDTLLLYAHYHRRARHLDDLKDELGELGTTSEGPGDPPWARERRRRMLQDRVKQTEAELKELSARLFQQRADAEAFVTGFMDVTKSEF
ncbi:MAG: hypothetical protein OK454_07240, partial [Thaumarchaeota archaeon]|nr:hypothetical protein [Nitrososphaerota archaeon]